MPTRYSVLVTRAIVQEAVVEVEASSVHHAIHEGARLADSESPEWTTVHKESSLGLTASRILAPREASVDGTPRA